MRETRRDHVRTVTKLSGRGARVLVIAASLAGAVTVRGAAPPEAERARPEDARPEDTPAAREAEADGVPLSDRLRPSPPAGEERLLDFDLLGEAKPPPETADAGKLRLRRKMLKVHQGLGLGLLGLQLATTVVGQLNYSDRYAGGPETNRYRFSHKALAYATLAMFATNGLVALLAPSPGTPKKLDRVMVHRIALFTAAAGMATQAVLGTYARGRVGHLDQDRFASAHLAVGYTTLAAVLVGVGVLVF